MTYTRWLLTGALAVTGACTPAARQVEMSGAAAKNTASAPIGRNAAGRAGAREARDDRVEVEEVAPAVERATRLAQDFERG